jgi:hypothetical protein
MVIVVKIEMITRAFSPRGIAATLTYGFAIGYYETRRWRV